MAYNPLFSGASTVEITTAEFYALAQSVEKIAAVKRLIAANDYVCTKDILAVLDIEKEGDDFVCSDR